MSLATHESLKIFTTTMSIDLYVRRAVLATLVSTTLFTPLFTFAATPTKKTSRKPSTIKAAAASALRGRGLWVWGDADNIVREKTAQDAFFAFVKAPHGNSAATPRASCRASQSPYGDPPGDREFVE